MTRMTGKQVANAALVIGACCAAACSGFGACDGSSSSTTTTSSGGSAAARTGLTTNTDSRTLADQKARLEFLAKYLKSKSAIADAEFIIHYQDNSGGGLAGPSDWDIRAAMEISGELAAWHAGWETCPASAAGSAAEPLPGWASELIQRRPTWQHASAPPRCFRDPRHRASVAYIYEAEHLVVYRNTTEAGAAK
jgi:hypothetical protein